MPLLIERVILLKSLDIFRESPEDILAELAASMGERSFSAGETVWESHGAEPQMHVIWEGQISVTRDGAQVQTLAAGDVYGELALLGDGAHVHSGVATCDGLSLTIDREPFEQLVSDHERTSRQVMRVLAQRLQRAPASAPAVRLADDVLGGLQERLVRREHR